MTQTATTVSIDRSTRPAAGKAAARQFPTFTVHELANGIPLYVVENHKQPYLSVQLVLRSGTSSDGDFAGLANFVCTLLLSGAGTLDAEALAEEIDFHGAAIVAGAGRDEITVRLGSLTRALPQMLDLMRDVVLHPTFPAEEIARERKLAIAGLKQSQAEPSYLASVQFRRELFAGTPYGHEVNGTAESLKKITREECVAFHTKHFTAGNAFFIAAGDANPETVISELNARFGSWQGEAPERPEFNIPGQPADRVIIVDRAGSLQTALRIGALAIERRHPDFLKLAVLNTLLGGYFNSRINQNLRERNGYTYGAGTGLDSLKHPGAFGAHAAVGLAVTADAIREILHELEVISSEPVPESELQMVKDFILGSQALQIETPGQVAGFVRAIALHGLPLDYFERFPELMSAVTSEELLATAARYLDPKKMSVIVAGAASSIREPLAQFGSVKVVDVNGKVRA